MRSVQTLVGLVVLIAAAVYFSFGTLSPCGVLRETVRHRDGLAAVLPDSIVDLALAGQYGPVSPGRCLAILMNGQGAPVANTAPPARPQTVQPATPRQVPQSATASPQDAMQRAVQITTQAFNECKAKRLRGELPTHVASVQCSNPMMLAVYNEARYRYMDLIERLAITRLDLAARIDRGELTEQQAELESNKIYAGLQAAERRRDAVMR